MSDTQETPIVEPEVTGDPQAESEVELVDDSLVDEIDISADSDSDVSDDLIDLDGQKLSKKELAELVAKRDNLNKDYTQKTMALAEERRRIAEVAAKRDEAVQKYGSHLSKIDQEISEFEAIDWDEVERQYPDQIEQLYSRAQRHHLKNLRERQEIAAAREGLIQQRTAEEVQEALRAIPDLQDPQKRTEFLQKAQSHLQQYGLDTSFVSNHKAIKLLAESISNAEKAKKYDEIFAKAKAKSRQNAASEAPPPPAPAKSGAAPSTGLSDDLPMDEWLRRREAQLKRQGRR